MGRSEGAEKVNNITSVKFVKVKKKVSLIDKINDYYIFIYIHSLICEQEEIKVVALLMLLSPSQSENCW